MKLLNEQLAYKRGVAGPKNGDRKFELFRYRWKQSAMHDACKLYLRPRAPGQAGSAKADLETST